MKYQEEDYLQMSGIQHFCFCRRQWALINLEQSWEDDARTTAGQIFHEVADDPTIKEKRGDLIIARAVPVSSSSLGLTGKCDVVEFRRSDDGVPVGIHEGSYKIIPVEYKVGHRKQEEWDEVQLCAEAIALEETFGARIEFGQLFYGEERRRKTVEMSKDLRRKTELLAEDMHSAMSYGKIPEAEPSAMCRKCSLQNICMPEALGHSDSEDYLQRMEESN
ncbi:hypothetical protein AUQ37_04660 [Candidatus Methanomethylophilus sp. 1R26]|uniref:CRISPR-associated protein Cas4 n=1 Tax=Candidatus Methanomethylophilus sp. 1R26 TaxID=1769296 RepID=UPI0007377640|nr:CRISPR-associated protein Cas4 [Candidatus Methanomethylophilus sp. 1R26]KUE74392.1 hypothetical protein AUQ37_04660 [Candidatus Methanomethylophilus sp. 1R26]